MKKTIIIVSTFITLGVVGGCQKTADDCAETEGLEKRNKLLQNEIAVLKDSLANYEEEFLRSQILLGISDLPILTVGRQNNVVMLLQTFDKILPKYEIYRKMDGKEVKVGEDDKTRFNFNFTPRSTSDKELEILLKIPYQGEIISIPAKMEFEVRE